MYIKKRKEVFSRKAKEKKKTTNNPEKEKMMKKFMMFAILMFTGVAFAGGGTTSLTLIPSVEGMLSSTDVGITESGKAYVRVGLIEELGFGDPELRGMFPATKGSWENPVKCEVTNGFFVCDSGRKFSSRSMVTFNFTLGGTNTWTGDQVTYFGMAEMKSPDFKGFRRGFYASVDNTVGGANHIGYPVAKLPWE